MTWLKNCVLGEDIVASPSSSPHRSTLITGAPG